VLGQFPLEPGCEPSGHDDVGGGNSDGGKISCVRLLLPPVLPECPPAKVLELPVILLPEVGVVYGFLMHLLVKLSITRPSGHCGRGGLPFSSHLLVKLLKTRLSPHLGVGGQWVILHTGHVGGDGDGLGCSGTH
jgi:hypothetical protein